MVVAISDRGVIEHRGKLPEIRKADQVPDLIKELMASHGRAASLLSTETRKDDMGFTLSPEEFTKISAFLQTRHRERQSEELLSVDSESAPPVPVQLPALQQATPEVAAPASSTPQMHCSKCRSGDVEIRYGHSYYLHCWSCEVNSPIRLTCPGCGRRARTRKSGKRFYRECAQCASSELYFTNP